MYVAHIITALALAPHNNKNNNNNKKFLGAKTNVEVIMQFMLMFLRFFFLYYTIKQVSDFTVVFHHYNLVQIVQFSIKALVFSQLKPTCNASLLFLPLPHVCLRVNLVAMRI